MEFKFSSGGFDDLERSLRDLNRRAEEISGDNSVPLKELLTPTFMASCSRFGSFEEMLSASGYKVESQEDREAIPDGEWDKFIAANTSYENWASMLGAAGKEWTAKQLGL